MTHLRPDRPSPANLACCCRRGLRPFRRVLAAAPPRPRVKHPLGFAMDLRRDQIGTYERAMRQYPATPCAWS